MKLRGGTLFSGIGAPETASPEIDWRWCAEIEPFPSAVLAARHPETRNLGDVTKVNWNEIKRTEPVDVLVFGSPCQSFSVAGKRLGMDDPRGNLALVAVGILNILKPRWFVFENVPGLLSSDNGRDFGTILAEMGKCGYGLSYRVLDAQYFGVPQRRRRVFVVGCLGDWRRAAAVLFERESLRWNPAPSRKAGQGLAADVAPCLEASGFYESSGSRSPALSPALKVQHPVAVCGTICKDSFSGGAGGRPEEAAQGHFIPIAIQEDNQNGVCLRNTAGSLRSDAPGTQPCGTLVMAHGQGNAEIVRDGSPSLTCNHEAPIVTHQLTASHDSSEDGSGRGVPFVPFCFESRIARNNHGQPKDYVPLLQASRGTGSDAKPLISTGHAVRRLLPVECERLQGFPDNYTAIQYRNKPAADGPRYKALGNSMAVPVMRWILTRLQQVHNIEVGQP